jgi:hypothetical protein
MRVYTCGLKTKWNTIDGVFYIHHNIQNCLDNLINPQDGDDISEYYIKVEEMEPLAYIRSNQDNLSDVDITNLCNLYDLEPFNRY